MRYTLLLTLTPLTFFLAAPSVAAANAVDPSFVDETTPEMAPALLSRDGQRYVVFHRFKKLACDPEDKYGEGICDWRVTGSIHARASGKTLSSFQFVWGRWKKKTDKTALAAKLTDFAAPVRAKQDSNGRRYAFGPYQAIIDAHKRAVRLRVIEAKSAAVRYSKHLPSKYRCRAQGKRTIWGAEIYWYPAQAVVLVNNPRACKRRFVELVSLK